MESVLKELYRKKSHQIDRTEVALELLNQKVEKKLSHYQKWANSPQPNVIGYKAPARKVGRSNSSQDKIQELRNQLRIRTDSLSESVEENIQNFKQRVSSVPGFEELEEKSNPVEIICWALILFVLMALTGYSFVRLIMDYMGKRMLQSKLCMWWSGSFKTITAKNWSPRFYKS